MAQMVDNYEVKISEDFKKLEQFKDMNIVGHSIFKEPDYKAKLQMGNLTFMSEKRFNWFKRFMLNAVFGIQVENLKKKE